MGLSATKKGHLRIKSGPDRDKYEHRAHVERMLREVWHPYFGNKLPPDFVVHHVDHIKHHNCPCNYLICPAGIHGSIEQHRYVRDSRGRYERIKRKAPTR